MMSKQEKISAADNRAVADNSMTSNRDPETARAFVVKDYKGLTAEQQASAVTDALAHLADASQDVQMRQLCYIFQADISYGLQVAKGLGIHIDPAMLQGLGAAAEHSPLR